MVQFKEKEAWEKLWQFCFVLLSDFVDSEFKSVLKIF